MARTSIALRLTISLSIATAVLWLGAAAISGLVMRYELQETFDETLKQGALKLLPLALHDLREPDEADEREVGGLGEDDEYFTWYVRDKAGRIIMRAKDAGSLAPLDRIADGFSELHGRRLYAKTDRRSGFSIIVVENTDHRREALAASVAALLLPLLGLIPVVGAAIWFSIRLAMRPVERLRGEIAARGSRNLTPLSAEHHPTELAPIAEAVADLLARLQAALDAERAFAASSAHELRTPIAGALAQTQQLAHELRNVPGSERLKDIEASLKHLSQLSEKLLQLARLDSGFARTDVTSDLLPVIDLVIHDFQRSPLTQDRVQLETGDETTLMAALDADAFSITLRNLIQNALIHGEKQGPVAVRVDRDRTIRVSNHGPIVPADVLARLGQPFMRGNTAASGSGLGLSIARMIAEQAGGSLTLHSPATGQSDGFEAAIHLPPA